MAAIPDASVDACVKDNALHLTAVFENQHWMQPWERVYAALTAAGLNKTFYRAHFNWFRNKRERAESEVKKAVAYALMQPRNQCEKVEYSIRVSVSDHTLGIHINMLKGFSPEQACENILSVGESLLALAEAKHLSLAVESYVHHMFPPPGISILNSYHVHSEDDDYTDDDDDDANPNWPSTTGNPSGGGRENIAKNATLYVDGRLTKNAGQSAFFEMDQMKVLSDRCFGTGSVAALVSPRYERQSTQDVACDTDLTTGEGYRPICNP